MTHRDVVTVPQSRRQDADNLPVFYQTSTMVSFHLDYNLTATTTKSLNIKVKIPAVLKVTKACFHQKNISSQTFQQMFEPGCRDSDVGWFQFIPDVGWGRGPSSVTGQSSSSSLYGAGLSFCWSLCRVNY